MESSAFRRAVCSDAAENSIMQTITIAVSAILIASGLVTAPGLINNARDNNSRGDLANSAYAEESMLAAEGHYWAYDNYKDSEYRKLERPGVEGSVNLTVSSSPRLIVDVSDDGQKWIGTSYSSSGKVFVRTSESAETVQVDADDFKSLAAPIAGEKITIEGGNGKSVTIPDGLSLSVAKNMYTASVENKPYFFGEAQEPGFGKPVTVDVGTGSPAPTTPPVPSGPATNVGQTDLSVPLNGWDAFTNLGNIYGMKQAIFMVGSDDTNVINQLEGFRSKAPSKTEQAYAGAPVSTYWFYENAPYSFDGTNNNVFKVSMVNDNGTLVTADWVKSISYIETVNSNGKKYIDLVVTSAAFKSTTLSSSEIDRLAAKKQFVISIGGYDYLMKG
jgi:hypothetical protein